MGLDQPAFGIDSHIDWDKAWTCDPGVLSETPLHNEEPEFLGLLSLKDSEQVFLLWKSNSHDLVRDLSSGFFQETSASS
jgi:hypothetical protein